MKKACVKRTSSRYNPESKKVLAHRIRSWVALEDERIFSFLAKFSQLVNTQTSLQLHKAIVNKDHMSLDEVDWSPSFIHQKNVLDYFFTEVLSKSSFLERTDDREYNTYKKFIDSESRCLETGFRLYNTVPDADVAEILELSRFFINDLLGEFKESSSFMKWGPGSTKTIKGKYVVTDKIKEIPFKIPRKAYHYHSNFISSYMHLYEPDWSGPFCPLHQYYEFDEVCVLCRVPKTSKTDRTISIEPTSLVTLTLHYGNILRRRLRKGWDIRLDDQRINQYLASKALDYGLATVDLSAASDSITPALITLLFPAEWRDMILSLRTSFYTLSRNGTVHYRQNKTAGMGNGITFPLQTIIYHAITLGLIEKLGGDKNLCHTYGDDIILPSHCVPLLKKVMQYIGFVFNDKKTHHLSTDKFRESCGEHFYNGRNITPVYLKDANRDLATCVRNHNRLYRWMTSHGLLNYIPLLNILRKGCPVDVYQEYMAPCSYVFYDMTNKICSIHEIGKRDETDSGFLVQEKRTKNNWKLRDNIAHVKISTSDAVLLRLFDMGSSKPHARAHATFFHEHFEKEYGKLHVRRDRPEKREFTPVYDLGEVEGYLVQARAQ